MPAIYQLVPGAMVARMWFNSLFPPIQAEETFVANVSVNGSIAEANVTVYIPHGGGSDVFSNLMVISTSLAIGVILGFAALHFVVSVSEPAKGL